MSEPVAWRVYCTVSGATGYLYTEKLPFEPGPGVRVRREPEPLNAGNAQEWQDIETAPRETRVLLGWYQHETWFSETGMACWRRNGIKSRHGFATHWQPIPEGPPLSSTEGK